MKLTVSAILILLCCCVLPHLHLSSSEAMMSKRGGVRLCGSMLVDTLTMICGNEFYGPDQKARRDNMGVGMAELYPGWFLHLASLKSDGFDLRSNLHRRQAFEGIVDECCRRSCTLSDLAAYCGKK